MKQSLLITIILFLSPAFLIAQESLSEEIGFLIKENKRLRYNDLEQDRIIRDLKIRNKSLMEQGQLGSLPKRHSGAISIKAYNKVLKDLNRLKAENKQLKAKLAQKEKENEVLRKQNKEVLKKLNLVTQHLEDKKKKELQDSSIIAASVEIIQTLKDTIVFLKQKNLLLKMEFQHYREVTKLKDEQQRKELSRINEALIYKEKERISLERQLAYIGSVLQIKTVSNPKVLFNNSYSGTFYFEGDFTKIQSLMEIASREGNEAMVEIKIKKIFYWPTSNPLQKERITLSNDHNENQLSRKINISQNGIFIDRGIDLYFSTYKAKKVFKRNRHFEFIIEFNLIENNEKTPLQEIGIIGKRIENGFVNPDKEFYKNFETQWFGGKAI